MGKFRSTLFLGMLSVGLLVGCQTVQPTLDKEIVTQAQPTKRSTSYDNTLGRVGQLLTAYTGHSEDYPVFIQSKYITNDTAHQGGLPSDLSRMVITTVNKIGLPFQYIPYDPDYSRGQLSLGAEGAIQHQLPEIVISGAISEYDRGVEGSGSGADLSVSSPIKQSYVDVDASIDNSKSLSRLTLDFQMLDFATMTQSGAFTSNTIDVRKQSKSRDLGFSIFGAGIGVNGSVSRQQGIHAAIRLLVEVSIAQLIGRHYEIPYWRLIDGMEPDQKVVASVVRNIRRNGSNNVLALALHMHGYDGSNLVDSDPDGLKAALNEIAAKNSLAPAPDGSAQDMDSNYIADIWLSVPMDSEFQYQQVLAALQEEQAQLEQAQLEQAQLEQAQLEQAQLEQAQPEPADSAVQEKLSKLEHELQAAKEQTAQLAAQQQHRPVAAVAPPALKHMVGGAQKYTLTFFGFSGSDWGLLQLALMQLDGYDSHFRSGGNGADELNVRYSSTLYPNSLKVGLQEVLQQLNLAGDVSSKGSDALEIRKSSRAGSL